MAEGRKCYEILGLKHGASEDEIKKAYKKLALQFHPDKNDSEDAKRKFQEIVYAYKYLTEGRDSFTTFNPHDLKVPEEFFRNLFERSKHHFYSRGGFAFFFPDDDDHVYFDDGDYCYQSDSSDDDTYRSRTYNNHSGSSSTYQPTAKQLKRREKKRRQKERAKEKKQKEREEKMKSETVYTDDVTADKNQTDHSVPSRKQSLTSNDGDSKISNKSNQQTKLNKKDKKKLESEQRKREKEMKEIAEELMKKQEQDMAKLKEKEKQAARKLEEEEESSFVPEFYAQKEKKSRKARQREKKRQDAAELQERINNARRGSTSASTVSASSVDSQNTQSNMASNNPGKLNQSTIKPSTQSKQTFTLNRHSSVKTDKNKQNLSQKKPGVMGSRFDVLEDLNSSGDRSDDLEPSTNEPFPSDHVYIDDEDDNDDESDDDEVDDKSDNDDKESCIDQKAQNFTDRGYSESSHQSGNRPSRGRPNFSQHQQGYAQTNNQYHDKMYREFSRSQGHGEYSRSPGHGQYGRSPGHGQYGRSPGCAPSFVPSYPSTNGFVRQSFNDQNFHPGFIGPNNHQFFRGPPPPQPRYPNGGYDRMRSPYPNPRFSHPEPRYGYPHNQRFRPENKYHAQFSSQTDRVYSGNGNTSYHDVPYNNNFVRPGGQRNFAPHNSYPQHNRKFENDAKIGGKKHQHPSSHKSNQTSSATSKNMFQSYSDINNQVPSFKKDVLDSLDDIDDHTEFKDPVLKDQSARLSDIDVSTDKFLSSEKLSVPEGMFNDKIKNYYKL